MDLSESMNVQSRKSYENVSTANVYNFGSGYSTPNVFSYSGKTVFAICKANCPWSTRSGVAIICQNANLKTVTKDMQYSRTGVRTTLPLNGIVAESSKYSKCPSANAATYVDILGSSQI